MNDRYHEQVLLRRCSRSEDARRERRGCDSLVKDLRESTEEHEQAEKVVAIEKEEMELMQRQVQLRGARRSRRLLSDEVNSKLREGVAERAADKREDEKGGDQRDGGSADQYKTQITGLVFESAAESAAKRRLRQSELEGQNLKSLCDSAVDKLAKLETDTAESTTKLEEAKQLLKENGIMLSEEREAKMRHLQYCAVVRVMKLELSRGWHSWKAAWEHEENDVQEDAGLLEEPGDVAGFRSYRAFPPMVNARLAMEPLEQRIGELEALLAAESKNGEEVKRQLARAEQLLRDHGIRLEHEREARAQHLMQIGVKRVMHRDLAKGWSSWHGFGTIVE